MAPPDPEPALARAPRSWLLALAFLVALAYAGLHTSFFLVRQVQVSGLVQLSQTEVAAAADILPGTYLWQVRPWTLARRLLALPLIQAVHVRMVWPDAIMVAVTERQPVALLDVGESADLEVGADGRVIALAVAPGQKPSGGLLPAPHVPLIHGVVAAGAVPGQVVHDPALVDGLSVAQGLGVQGQALLGSLTVDAQGQVTAHLTSGLDVRFGDGSQARAKTEVLLGLLHVIASRGIKVDEIDVASPTAPTVHEILPRPPAIAAFAQTPSASGPVSAQATATAGPPRSVRAQPTQPATASAKSGH